MATFNIKDGDKTVNFDSIGLKCTEFGTTSECVTNTQSRSLYSFSPVFNQSPGPGSPPTVTVTNVVASKKFAGVTIQNFDFSESMMAIQATSTGPSPVTYLHLYKRGPSAPANLWWGMEH